MALPVIHLDRQEGGGNAQGSIYKGTFDNYTALIAAFPTSNFGDTAVVENPEGTAWLPWTLGGTYFPEGTYYWDGTIWDSNVKLIAEELQKLQQPYEIIEFDPQLIAPTYQEGVLWYDAINKTLSMYNNESDVSLQIGQELWVRAKNNTGLTILNGSVVYISGVDGILPTIDLADASDEAKSTGTLGIATHDIENNTIGVITTSGSIKEINTSAFTAGQVLYLSDSVPGGITDTIPSSPSYIITIGTAVIINASLGTIQARLNIGSNNSGIGQFFNGSSLEDTAVSVTSDGITVDLAYGKEGGGDVNHFFDSVFVLFDSTPTATVQLTAGTDVLPTLNWVFIPQSTNVLTVSTTGFPSAEHAPIAKVLVQSPPSVQADDCLMCFVWSDHLSNDVNQGHLSHLNSWIRKQHATWLIGVESSIAIVTNGGTPDDVEFSSLTGKILQVHDHDFPAFNTATGSEMYVVNDFTAAYTKITDLNQIVALSDGTAIVNNNRYNLVVFGVVSEETGESKLYVNLPNGTYNSDDGVINDIDKTSNFDIPNAFKGTAFLISRISLKFTTASGGTYEVINEEDLRGLFPSTSAGSGTSNATFREGSLVMTMDGGNAEISAGIKFTIPVDFNFEVIQWTILGIGVGSVVFDVWKDTYANYPPTVADTITGGNPPTIVSAEKNQDAILAGWTTSFVAGETVIVTIDNITDFEILSLAFKINRT